MSSLISKSISLNNNLTKDQVVSFLKRNPDFLKQQFPAINDEQEKSYNYQNITSFYQKKAQKLDTNYEKLKNDYYSLIQNGVENQKNYEKLLSIVEKLCKNNSPVSQVSKIEFFLSSLSNEFNIEKIKLICFTPRQKKGELFKLKQHIKLVDFSLFWDEEKRSLFSENSISFAPIEKALSMQLFNSSHYSSALLIPLNYLTSTSEIRKTIKNKKAFLAMGSTDEKRFLPDSTYNLDFLNHIKKILDSLISD